MYIKDLFHDCQKQATNEPELLSHTRQYICKELILELKLPMLITIQTCHIATTSTQTKKLEKEDSGSSNHQYKICQLLLTDKFAKKLLPINHLLW